MRELFEEQLLLLNQELTEMGSLCEEIISLATQALGSYTKELGEKVSKVGAKIDEEERTIETICMRLLLRQQPVARDLRAVSAALKMITDMERIGDQAEDIVEIIPCMIAHPHEEYPKIREMAKETIAMVTDSVDAYVKQDVYLAKAVQMHDDVVDNAMTRRGRPTVNAVWDNHIAVLAGDYFTSSAMQEAISTGDIRIVESLCNLGRRLSLGEICLLYTSPSPRDRG